MPFACHSAKSVVDVSLGTETPQSWDHGKSRRFRTEQLDMDGDGEGDHIALSQVHNFEDGVPATTYQRKVAELTLDAY